MNKYRSTNPNNKEVREYKSRTTEKIIGLDFVENSSKIGGGLADREGRIGLDFGDFTKDDPETFDIGMVFMHELGHEFFGDKDPDRNEFGQTDFSAKTPNVYKNRKLGDAVERVNRYRKELDLPVRDSYKTNPYMDHKLPFRYPDNSVIWLKSFKKE